jgi:hypothetical protein
MKTGPDADRHPAAAQFNPTAAFLRHRHRHKPRRRRRTLTRGAAKLPPPTEQLIAMLPVAQRHGSVRKVLQKRSSARAEGSR